MLGGGTADWAFELMEIPTFDLETRKWTTLFAKADDSAPVSIIPFSRKCHSAVQVSTPTGVQVFVAGGYDGNVVFNNVWRLNLENLQWTLMKKSILPNNVYFHSASVTSFGCMYIFGGIISKQTNMIWRSNDMYKMWIYIPKLSEMAWEALLHYCPDLGDTDRNSLLNLGIPKHFVDRVTK